jgi:hypothetical protein
LRDCVSRLPGIAQTLVAKPEDRFDARAQALATSRRFATRDGKLAADDLVML